MSEWVEYLLKLLAKVDDAEQAQEDDEVLIPEDYKGLTQKALQQLIDLDEGKHMHNCMTHCQNYKCVF